MSPKWSGVYETIGNGNLGILPTSPVGTFLAVGPCSGADDLSIHIFSKADIGSVRTELGSGDLCDRVLDFLSLCGQKGKIIAVPANKDVVGSIAAATKTGSGTAVGVSGGSPTGSYDIVVQIVTGGDFGTATYQISFDGGDTWFGPYTTPAVPGAVTLGSSGVTLTWSDIYAGDGSFVADDQWAFSTVSPSCTLNALLAALDAGAETNLPFEYALAATPTNQATWTGLGVWRDDMFAAHRPVRVLTETPIPTSGMSASAFVTAALAGISGFSHDAVSVCVGTMEILDADGYSIVRGISGLVAGLIAASDVHESIGRTMYCKLTPALGQGLALSDGQLQALDAARYIVARQYAGLTGWYVNNGNVAADSTSDYQTIENCRVIDNVIRNLRNEALKHVHSTVRVVNGVADPSGLKALEGGCKGVLKAIGNTFSSGRIEIPEGQDVLASQEIDANISIVPFGYMKAINLGFALVKI